MISSVSQHYENLLAEHYERMFGVPFEAKVAERRKLLEEAGVQPHSAGSAIDLGCGSGSQSVALLEARIMTCFIEYEGPDTVVLVARKR